MAKPLTGKVCLATGATRGIGRGIAVQLGQAGATVYVTGRTLKKLDGVPGSLEETAREIELEGGICIPVQCDHGVDEQVVALFDQIKREQDGRLDLLVNNAYAAVSAIMTNIGTAFYDQGIQMWDNVNRVGLRNNYLCTILASKMMVSRKQGLIVNISSPGGLKYLFNIPYGIGKEAMDRMAADCAIELWKHKVAMVSLWPGMVQTELLTDALQNDQIKGEYYQPGAGMITSKKIKKMFDEGESPEFSGKCVVHLAQDLKIMKKTGRVLLASDLGTEYGFTDVNGRAIPSARSIRYLLQMAGWRKTAYFIPSWIKAPYSFMTLYASKF